MARLVLGVVCGLVASGCGFERPLDVARVAGTVAGLWQGGEPLVLRLTAPGVDETLAVTAEGAVEFASVLDGDASFAVEIAAQPALHECEVRSLAPLDVGCRGPARLRLAYPHERTLDLATLEPVVELSLLAGSVRLAALGGALTSVKLGGLTTVPGVLRRLPIAGDEVHVEVELAAGALTRAFTVVVRRGAIAPAVDGLLKPLGPGGRVGSTLAASEDWVAVGAPSFGPGRVELYEQRAAGWELAQQLIGDDTTGDLDYGSALAVSGTLLVVGAPGRQASEGAGYVLRRGATWLPVRSLGSTLPAADKRFGAAVAGDGAWLAAGEPNPGGDGNVLLWQYTPATNTWDPRGALGVRAGGFGGVLALAGDQLFVAAAGEGSGAGAVYVFTRSGAQWVAGQRLAQAGGGFGASIAVAGDLLVIGAPRVDGTGAAYAYRQVGGTWMLEQQLRTSAGMPPGIFGAAVATDGHAIAVSAPTEASQAGAVHLFARDGAGWRATARLLAPNPDQADVFGSALAFAGGMLLVGAPGEDSAPTQPPTDNSAADAGAVYRFY